MQKSPSTPARSNNSIISSQIISQEALLWRAVLAQAVRDIYDTDERVRRDALKWILTRDFETVCDMAFVEPETMKSQLANLATLSIGLARKYGSMLRSEIIAEPA